MPLFKRVLRGVLVGAMSLVLMGLFLIAVVMGQPEAEEDPASAPQALPEPLGAPVAFSGSADVDALAEFFPAPMLLPESSGLTLTQADCRDVPFEEGVARVLTLLFQTESRESLTAVSIYPARALELLSAEGYVFSDDPTVYAAGLTWISMRNGTEIRLHAQSDEALYVLTAPVTAGGDLSGWMARLQLYSAGE